MPQEQMLETASLFFAAEAAWWWEDPAECQLKPSLGDLPDDAGVETVGEDGAAADDDMK